MKKINVILCAVLTVFSSVFVACSDSSEPSVPQLSFTQGGGDQVVEQKATEIICTLKGNIPFNQLTASSDAAWCKTTFENVSSTGSDVLCKLTVRVAENISMQSREAKVSVRSADGAIERSFKVSQMGNSPFFTFVKGGVDEEHNADPVQLSSELKSNVPFESLSITSNEPWCSVQLLNVSTGAELPYVYQVKTDLEENISDKDRTVVITLKSQDGNLSHSFSYTQTAATLSLPTTALGFNKNSATRTLKVTASNNWEATSSADWCKIERNNEYLTVRISSTTVDREAVISFKERDDKIVVSQTKYSVGETYSEGNLKGTVAYIGDLGRFIYKKAGEDLMYNTSTTLSIIGTNSETDGMYNMDVIKKYTSWRSTFPAFNCVDELNTGGITGWYLPAIGELDLMLQYLEGEWVWSSTEQSLGAAWVMHLKNNAWEKSSLNMHYIYQVKIFGIHRF